MQQNLVCGWVGLIRPKAEKNCPAFSLQTRGQARGLEESFLGLDLGFVVVVELENDVREALEIGIHCAIEREFEIARIEAALKRIVIADFEPSRLRSVE